MLVHIVLFIYISATNIDFASSGCEKSFVVMCDGLSHVQYNKEKKAWTELLVQQRNYEEKIPQYTLTNKQLTRDLSNLKWLVITEHLTEVDKKAFIYLKNLQQLILYDNNISTIKKLTFAGFWNLFKLGLENNNIQEMEARVFVSAKIEMIDLSHNKLQILRRDLFAKCGQITTLKITHNRLWQIESNSLPKDLKNLHLDHNSLESLPPELNSLKELEKLTVSHNNIDNINVSQLRSLKNLDLSFNNILSLNHEFDDLSNLEYLDLSSNHLEKFTFSPQLIQNVKEPFFLLLAHNRLRNLDLASVTKKVTVTLSGNPWNCKCLERMQREITNNSITKTNCEKLISGSGLNPCCFADDNQKCSEYRLSESALEKFKSGYKNNICDIFSDVDSMVPKIN